MLTAIEGLLETMECDKVTRLHVRTAGKVAIFVMPDPRIVVVRGSAGGPVDLQCGAQNPPRPVRIEYQALSNTADATGLVHSLEFK
jgi:hypothetical protein